MDFINYDDRTEVDGKMVWAELYYNRELTDKEMKDYDLVKQNGGWLIWQIKNTDTIKITESL